MPSRRCRPHRLPAAGARAVRRRHRDGRAGEDRPRLPPATARARGRDRGPWRATSPTAASAATAPRCPAGRSRRPAGVARRREPHPRRRLGHAPPTATPRSSPPCCAPAAAPTGSPVSPVMPFGSPQGTQRHRRAGLVPAPQTLPARPRRPALTPPFAPPHHDTDEPIPLLAGHRHQLRLPRRLRRRRSVNPGAPEAPAAAATATVTGRMVETDTDDTPRPAPASRAGTLAPPPAGGRHLRAAGRDPSDRVRW